MPNDSTVPPPVTVGAMPQRPKPPWNRFTAGIPSFLFYVGIPYVILIATSWIAAGHIGIVPIFSSSGMLLVGLITGNSLFRPFRRYPVDERLTQRLRDLMPGKQYQNLVVRLDVYSGPQYAQRKGQDLLIPSDAVNSLQPEMIDFILIRTALQDLRRYSIWVDILLLPVCFGFVWMILHEFVYLLIIAAALTFVLIELSEKVGGRNERALAITKNIDAALAVVPLMDRLDGKPLANWFDYERRLKLLRKAEKLGFQVGQTPSGQ